MSLFCNFGKSTLFTNAYVGHGETFYSNCTKHDVPKIARNILDVLGCGVVI